MISAFYVIYMLVLSEFLIFRVLLRCCLGDAIRDSQEITKRLSYKPPQQAAQDSPIFIVLHAPYSHRIAKADHIAAALLSKVTP